MVNGDGGTGGGDRESQGRDGDEGECEGASGVHKGMRWGLRNGGGLPGRSDRAERMPEGIAW